MKSNRSSNRYAEPGTVRLSFNNCPVKLHAAFLRVADAHGLKFPQAMIFVMNWVVNQSTITPDISEGDWGE